MLEAAIIYILTFLIPINGILFIGLRNERKRNRNLLVHISRLNRKRGIR